MNLFMSPDVYQLTLPKDQEVSVTVVTAGQSTVLTCGVTGEGRPPIMWTRHRQLLNVLNLEDISVRTTADPPT